MQRSSTDQDLVLRLTEGVSTVHEVVLESGCARPPFAVGREAPWRVRAGHVSASHVMLAFNGSLLFVSALPGELALLDGVPLSPMWTEAPVPSELRFGSARIRIGRRARIDALALVFTDEVTRLSGVRPARLRSHPHPRHEEAVTCLADFHIPALARGPSSEDRTLPPCLPSRAAPTPRQTVRVIRRAAPSLSQEEVETWVPRERPPVIAAASPPIEASEEETCVPSSMPMTLPEEPEVFDSGQPFGSPFPAATAHPSCPTLAVPQPAVGTREEGRDAPAPDARHGLHAAPPVLSASREFLPPHLASVSSLQRKTREVVSSWERTSLPKRAIAILLLAALLAVTLLVGPLAARASGATKTHPPSDSSAPAAPPARQTAVTGFVPVQAPLPARLTIPQESRVIAVPAATEGRDKPGAERRALDAAASGLDASAATQYEVLAAAHPENAAFCQAARILRHGR